MAKSKSAPSAPKVAINLPTPSQFVAELQSNRLADTIQIRPTVEQMKYLDEITRVEAERDPTVSKSDILRAALAYFIAAWKAENDGELTPGE